MREPIRDKGRLEHILECINNIDEFIQNKTVSEIIDDKMCYFAIVKNIEIIGEASFKLTEEFRKKHTSTPWNYIIKMRHVLVHDYYQISSSEVISVISKDLQPLKKQIEEYILELENL